MIQPVNALAPKVLFKGRNKELGNPVNRTFAKRLAVLNAGGVSVVTGALTAAISRSYTASWRNSGLFGVGAGLISMMFICPHFLYKSGIKSFRDEKEMDVFSQEKEVQKKLLTDVREAINNHSDNIDGKLENYSKTKKMV